jgi:Zn-dependent peptidase ImmA (M78 family)
MQANQFAADLLMAEHFLHSAPKGKMIDLEDEGRLTGLAKSFSVSVQALMFRIINLNLAHQIWRQLIVQLSGHRWSKALKNI